MEAVFSKAGPLQGEVNVPPDKSISHRAAILGAMAEGKTIARPFLRSEDCLSTLNCLKSLGVELKLHGERLIVNGKGPEAWQEPTNELDAGNSATTMRAATARPRKDMPSVAASVAISPISPSRCAAA
jgi:3-phosphoshikimate 1-carboxyvinyltransferase